MKQQNVNKYIKSNFFRILLFFGRGTMQVSQDVFRFVPLQNFTDESYIDWSKSISEIDTELVFTNLPYEKCQYSIYHRSLSKTK